MIPTKKKKRAGLVAGGVDPETLAAGRAGAPSAARQAAQELVAGGSNGATPLTGAAGDSVGDDDIDPDYLDYIKEQKGHMSATRRSGDLPTPNAPVKMPEPFEKVSICVKGPCKWYFELVAPVSARIFDDAAPGGQRHAMATIRRCLVGAVKLDTDEPIKVSMMKHIGTEAPYGAQRCSHWTPMTNDELASRDERIIQYKDREAEQARLAEVREEAVQTRILAPPPLDPSVEDPGASLEDAASTDGAVADATSSADDSPDDPAALLRELENPEGV